MLNVLILNTLIHQIKLVVIVLLQMANLQIVQHVAILLHVQPVLMIFIQSMVHVKHAQDIHQLVLLVMLIAIVLVVLPSHQCQSYKVVYANNVLQIVNLFQIVHITHKLVPLHVLYVKIFTM